MDTSTGHLVTYEQLKTFPLEEQAKYKPVPKRLRKRANAALAGRPETHINLRGHDPMADWARKDRRERQRQRKLEKRNRQAARRQRRERRGG